MVPFTTAVVFLFLFVLQTSVSKMFGWTAPDVPLLASIYFGLRYMKTAGWQAGILSGLLQDVSSFGLTGINILSKGLCGMGTGLLMENHFIDRETPVTWVILIFLSTGLNQAILLGYTASFFDAQVSFWAGFWAALGQAFVNLLLGLPLFSTLIWLEARMRRMLGIRQA